MGNFNVMTISDISKLRKKMQNKNIYTSIFFLINNYKLYNKLKRKDINIIKSSMMLN